LAFTGDWPLRGPRGSGWGRSPWRALWQRAATRVRAMSHVVRVAVRRIGRIIPQ
jgi:hypothetical protein